MTDPITFVRAADPAAGLDLDPGARADMDAALERLLIGEPAAMPTVRFRRVAQFRTGAVAATAAACAVGLAVILPGGGTSGPGVQAASAASVLRSARAVALAPGEAGPWTAVVLHRWQNNPFRRPEGGWGVALIPYTIEQWSSDGGEQLERNTRGTDIQFPRASDKAAYGDPAKRQPPTPYSGEHDPATQPIDPDGKLIRQDTQDIGSWTVADIHALPTDPAELAAALTRGVRHSPDSQPKYDVVTQATALLLSSLPTAEQRAALYTVLQRTPGAQLVPNVTDPEGRTGDGVRFVKPFPPAGTEGPGGYDATLLFDPGTHALLGVRQDDDWSATIGRKLTSWSLVIDAHRAQTAPKPDLERRYPAGSHGRKPPELIPIG
jgi:hypothetical protein